MCTDNLIVAKIFLPDSRFRFIKNSKITNYPKLKFLLNRLANNIIKIIFLSNYNDFTNAFKIYKKSSLLKLYPLVSENFNIFLELWMQIKIISVSILTYYHFLLGKYLNDFAIDANPKSSKFFRIINEVPTIILIVVVFVVVFKPLI